MIFTENSSAASISLTLVFIVTTGCSGPEKPLMPTVPKKPAALQVDALIWEEEISGNHLVLKADKALSTEKLDQTTFKKAELIFGSVKLEAQKIRLDTKHHRLKAQRVGFWDGWLQVRSEYIELDLSQGTWHAHHVHLDVDLSSKRWLGSRQQEASETSASFSSDK